MIIVSSYIICLSIITVNNKENKDEEFLSFLQLSIGLFLSGVSVLTPNPGRLWDVTDLSDSFTNMDTFYPLYPASQYIILGLSPWLQKYVQFQLYQWQASGTEHTDTSKQKVIILFLLDIDTATIQSLYSLLSLDFSVNEGTERGMSYRRERERETERHFY